MHGMNFIINEINLMAYINNNKQLLSISKIKWLDDNQVANFDEQYFKFSTQYVYNNKLTRVFEDIINNHYIKVFKFDTPKYFITEKINYGTLLFKANNIDFIVNMLSQLLSSIYNNTKENYKLYSNYISESFIFRAFPNHKITLDNIVKNMVSNRFNKFFNLQIRIELVLDNGTIDNYQKNNYDLLLLDAANNKEKLTLKKFINLLQESSFFTNILVKNKFIDLLNIFKQYTNKYVIVNFAKINNKETFFITIPFNLHYYNLCAYIYNIEKTIKIINI